MRRWLTFIWRLNIPTIIFNFHYFPFRQAIRFPCWVSWQTWLLHKGGAIEIRGPLQPGMIRIGLNRIGIFDRKRSRTIWEVRGKVVFEGKAEIGHGSKISVGPGGVLHLGEGFAMTAESTIIAYHSVHIGSDCLFSWEVLITDTDLHTIKDKSGIVVNKPAPIHIGDHVWIGCRCTILKGSFIPAHSVIAAQSLVNKKLEAAGCLYGGNPAALLRKEVAWEL